MRRRDFLKISIAGGAVAGGIGTSLGLPIHVRRAWAQGPIKIGIAGRPVGQQRPVRHHMYFAPDYFGAPAVVVRCRRA